MQFVDLEGICVLQICHKSFSHSLMLLLEFEACHIIVMYGNIWKTYYDQYLNICAALNGNALV